MFDHAAFSAAQPNSSLKSPRALIPGCSRCIQGYSKPPSKGTSATRISAAIWANSAGRDAKDVFGALGSLPPRIPSSTRGHASGPNRRPAARRRSASPLALLRGLGSSQNKFESSGKERRSNFFRAPPRKHSLALGSRALSLGFA
jgi:hypothetical protein